MLSLAMQRRASRRPVATLVLLPSLGSTTCMWHPLLDELAEPVDVWAFDAPGHGVAPAFRDGGTHGAARGLSLGDLADGVLPHLDDVADDAPVLAVGVSMGGAVALELATRSPRIDGVACINSALGFGTPAGWRSIVERTRAAGSAAFDPDGTRAGWFTDAFATATAAGRDAVDSALRDLASIDVESYIACCEALARYEGRQTAAAVSVPGVAVGGRRDRATRPTAMAELAARNPLFAYAELPGAHLAVIENAREAAAVVTGLRERMDAARTASTPTTSSEGRTA